MTYKHLISILFGALLFWEQPLMAQAPFTGGVGDGYAQAELAIGLSVGEASLTGIRLAPLPLPAGQPLWLTQEGQPLQEAQFTLFDPSGQKLFTAKLTAQTRQAITLPELPTGLYLVRIKSARGMLHRKLLLE